MTLRTRSPGILLAFTFLLTIMAPDARGAPHEAAGVWQAFRGALPYHAQLVAMTDPDEEDRRILVISEPPPSLDPDAVLDILGDPVIEARAARHEIGYDGWVEDWVITLGPIEEWDLREKLAQLHLATFGTTYKADVVRLPLEEGMSGYEAPPSISVSAAELKNWLFDAALKLQPLLPGPSGTLSELVELGAAGVFIGAEPGLVVWLMPRDLNAIDRAAARQFMRVTRVQLDRPISTRPRRPARSSEAGSRASSPSTSVAD